MSDSRKVLIVDDNEINGMLAAELLGAFSLETVVASSGEEAIRKAKEGRYSFVLMDHVMPGMSGVEATSAIRDFSDMPIYAMTGELTDEVIAAFKKAGAQGYIHKPLKPKEIYDVVRENLSESEYTMNGEIQAMLAPEKVEDGGEESTLKKYLSRIEGIDYESGMINSMNKEENYLRLLKVAATNIRQYTAILSEYLKSAEPEVLKLASHSLKTVFANIGIEKLRMESEKMESHACALIKEAELNNTIANFGEEHQNDIADYISDTMKAALELEDALEAYMSEVSTGPEDYSEPEEKLSDEDFIKAIQYTRDAFSRFEIDFILEGLEALKKSMVHEKRKKIEAAIDAASGFMYEDALRYFEDAINTDEPT